MMGGAASSTRTRRSTPSSSTFSPLGRQLMSINRTIINLSCLGVVSTIVPTILGCNNGDGNDLFSPSLGTVTPLSASDVQLIISRAVAAISSPFLHVAVVDRTGDVLGVFSTASDTIQDEDDIAVSIARTAALFSNSQAPLTSLTVQTLSTFHFPPTFGPPFVPSACPVSSGAQCPVTAIAPQETTTGILGTPQGPLWQINASNRGAAIASASTNPPTTFISGQAYNPSRNLDGSIPSPGITLLPGG